MSGELTDKQKKILARIESQIDDAIQKPSTIKQARAFTVKVLEYIEVTDEALTDDERREKSLEKDG